MTSTEPIPPTEPAPTAANVPRRSPFRTAVRVVVSLGLGLFVGVVLHYLIYRLSLPSKPFIYVSF